jgi:hypothetical protein
MFPSKTSIIMISISNSWLRSTRMTARSKEQSMELPHGFHGWLPDLSLTPNTNYGIVEIGRSAKYKLSILTTRTTWNLSDEETSAVVGVQANSVQFAVRSAAETAGTETLW